MRCLLVGNYGVGNLGDELLREYFVKRFPEVEWTVLSHRPSGPREVPRLPLGPRSFFTTPWWRTLGALCRCDAVVFGGGSLFTDVESVHACVLWGWHARVARILGKRVFLAFQGVGPFRTGRGEKIAKSAVARASFVSVRDEQSRDRCVSWGVTAVLSADPVWMLLPEHSESARRDGPLAVVPRMNSGPALRDAVLQAIGKHPPPSIRILSLQPDAQEERAACVSLTGAIDVPSAIVAVRSLQQLTDALRDCSALVTDRYHGALVGFALGVPTEVVPQHPADKIDVLEGAFLKNGREGLLAAVEHGERALRSALSS